MCCICCIPYKVWDGVSMRTCNEWIMKPGRRHSGWSHIAASLPTSTWGGCVTFGGTSQWHCKDDRLFNGWLLQLCALRHIGHESQQTAASSKLRWLHRERISTLRPCVVPTHWTTLAADQIPNTIQDGRHSVQGLDNTTAELPCQYHQVSCCFTQTLVLQKEFATWQS